MRYARGAPGAGPVRPQEFDASGYAGPFFKVGVPSVRTSIIVCIQRCCGADSHDHSVSHVRRKIVLRRTLLCGSVHHATTSRSESNIGTSDGLFAILITAIGWLSICSLARRRQIMILGGRPSCGWGQLAGAA